MIRSWSIGSPIVGVSKRRIASRPYISSHCGIRISEIFAQRVVYCAQDEVRKAELTPNRGTFETDATIAARHPGDPPAGWRGPDQGSASNRTRWRNKKIHRRTDPLRVNTGLASSVSGPWPAGPQEGGPKFEDLSFPALILEANNQ
jgi:hypothetical protein